MPRPPKQDTQLLEAALIGFQHMKEEVERKIAELRSQTGGFTTPAAVASAGTTKSRTMSAAARKRIALAQKKRWAAYKAEHGSAVARVKPAKRELSAAGRARIVAATKKRWAEYRKNQQAKKAS